MAISFSRPDPSSPSAVADANFPTARRGFDQQEVREFLRMVAAEMARMQDRERYFEGEMRAMRQQRSNVPADLDDEGLARLLGEETARIVRAARESSAEIRAKAEDLADRLLREAKEEAQALRQEAEQEATRRRKDAEVDAEAELAMAKQQGREMVEEARAYRERALSELSRRRDLARQQIDQLVHGRDRLVQAFERARLVAADVVAELVPLGELDEYVNLAPTTGPVPVMVPASRLADASAISDDALTMGRPPSPADPPDRPAADSTRSIDRLLSDEPPPADAIDAIDASAAEPSAAEDHPATATGADAPMASGATVLQFPGGASRGDFARPADDVAPDAGEPEVNAVDEVDEVDELVDAAGAAEHAVDEVDDDDITATDVDDLFARLRSEEPAGSGESAEQGAVGSDDAAAGPSPFERRDEALTPLIVSSARKLKRLLADEQNSVLDRLRRTDAVRSLDDIVLAGDDHGARYFDMIEDDLMAAAAAGADSLGGATVAVGDGGVLAPIRTSLVGGLVTPLRERLADRIAAGDGDNDTITKSVRAIYREWKTKHIDDHLDDLLHLAYGRGVYAALEPGEPCRWVFDPAVGPCSDCEDNSLQGRVPAGTAFPTGHVAAPAHTGCRCLLARSTR